MSRITRRLPSPATVLAAVALFFALSGSAYALVVTGGNIRNGTVSGVDIKNRSLRGGDIATDSVDGDEVEEATLGAVPAAEGVTRFAVVTGAGVAARGRGVSSAARTGAGRYQVIFDRDVRNCAYLATLGDVGAAAPPTGEITTSSLSTNVNGVSIRTEASDGAAADRPFHLVVSC